MNQREIIIENLEKRYGKTVVFHGFFRRFFCGETTVLMGRSGCGKTTLLRLLMGLEAPDGGQILGVPENRTAVFQEDRLFEDFSAVENIRAALPSGGQKIAGTKKEDAGGAEQIHSRRENRAEQLTEIREALTELGIMGDAQDQPVSELSGGMRRRAAIARAVLAGRRFGAESLLLFDEPFDGLDPETKAGAARFIRENCAGKTVIVITHSEEEAALMGGKIVRLEKKED